jgi:hypothetical protein
MGSLAGSIMAWDGRTRTSTDEHGQTGEGVWYFARPSLRRDHLRPVEVLVHLRIENRGIENRAPDPARFGGEKRFRSGVGERGWKEWGEAGRSVRRGRKEAIVPPRPPHVKKKKNRA